MICFVYDLWLLIKNNSAGHVLLQPTTVEKLLRVAPDGAVKNLMAAYIYNCSSSLKHYAKYNERNLGPLKVLHESFCIIRWFLRVLPTDYRYIPLKSGNDFFQAAGSDKQRKLGDGSKTRHTRLLLPPPSPHSPRFPLPPAVRRGIRLSFFCHQLG